MSTDHHSGTMNHSSLGYMIRRRHLLTGVIVAVWSSGGMILPLGGRSPEFKSQNSPSKIGSVEYPLGIPSSHNCRHVTEIIRRMEHASGGHWRKAKG